MTNILVISDTHFPYCHRDALKFCLEVSKHYKCEEVWHVGDEVDFHNASRHESDPSLPTALEEYDKAYICMQDWFATFPHMKLARGNHSDIPIRQAKTLGMPEEFLKTPNDLWGIPKANWEWRTHWRLRRDGKLIQLQHGVGPSCNAMSTKALGINLVGGHYHGYAGIVYRPSPLGTFWAMTVGCLVDVDSPAFGYFRQNDPTKMPQLGCGVILNGNPHLVPMELNKRGRWKGRL